MYNFVQLLSGPIFVLTCFVQLTGICKIFSMKSNQFLIICFIADEVESQTDVTFGLQEL